MRRLVVLAVFGLVIDACTLSEESATTGEPVTTQSETSDVLAGSSGVDASLPACHPTNDRADCTLVVVLFDEPIDLAAAEAFAAAHDASLNVLYRVDPVCVAKDFPIMGRDLGQTPSRRSYWQADERMDRISRDIGAGLVPPPTIGGFDVVIDQRMSEEWSFARMPGVIFDSIGLWIDEAGAAALAGEYDVDFPEHWRYEHTMGRGEIAVDRDYDPPSLMASEEVEDCSAVP